MKKVAFLDRDGTLIIEPKDTKQISMLEEMEFLPHTISSLKKLQTAGYNLVIVSNQDGLSTSANPLKNYNSINQKILQIFASEDIKIFKWLTCPHYESEQCKCRKPKTGLVDFDFSPDSIMIGDRLTDLEFGANLGIRSFQINSQMGWSKILELAIARSCSVERKTNEVLVHLDLNIDFSNKTEIDTGLKFFDHMLEQIAKHGKFGLTVKCKGDLEVDEHHTIEDVALCLGEAYKTCLGSKVGIARFSSERILPLDESISFVSLDISSRPFCSFIADFEREYCGDMPTEMIGHFFQSFAISSDCTLHLKLEGKNTHHKIEACFKAFAKCLHDSSRLEGIDINSTKGLL